MRVHLVTALSLAVASASVWAQAPPQGAPGARGPGARRQGGFVPGQQRAPENPAQIERGKTLYAVSCRGCHGADLRGGDMGGPNLLRSQAALMDKDGELIIPVIEGSRQSTGMPAIRMSPEDEKAVSAYLRSIVATIGRQGMPPSIGKEAPGILVGNAAEGQAYFAARCGSCHSATGDMKGIATKYSDPKALQNAWIFGGARSGRGGFGQSAPGKATVTVTLPSGERVTGKLIRIDDFIVSVGLDDGSSVSFSRDGESPKVEVHDPQKAHRDLLPIYTDKGIHDVTAYLVTLK